MKWLARFFVLIPLLSSGWAHGGPLGEGSGAALDRLLEQVRSGRDTARQLNAQREAEFLEKRERQQALLSDAEAALAIERRLSETLEREFERNELQVGELEKRLSARLGNLGELVGVVRVVAGETKSDLEHSVISAQFTDRTDFLGRMAESRELPTTDQLGALWFSLLQEMTESGRVARFTALVVGADGRQAERDVVRVGSFNAFSDGRYLTYLPRSGRLVELSRQPAWAYLSLAAGLGAATSGVVPVGIDPTRGALMSLLVQTPTIWERVKQGGAIGYIIIVIAMLGAGFVAERGVYLFVMDRRIKVQLTADRALSDNPLGHVIAAYEQNRDLEPEALELKLDEAVLQGIPKLERGLSTIRTLATVAPLLGLLGTVTGMIETFQSITLFGTGDPKVMAGGISQALVTTVLGLVTAIPLVLMHTAVRARSNRLIHILEEQSAGIVASRAEGQRDRNG